MSSASVRFVNLSGGDLPISPDLNALENFFFKSFIKDRVTDHVRNVQTRAHLLEVDNHIVPVTVNWREYSNSFVCSPYSTYIRYLYEELATLGNPLLVNSLRFLTCLLAPWLKAGKIDQVIQVNNWLISTNLYPDLPENFVKKTTDFLTKEYPGHGIMFRSLTKATNGALIQSLAREGYLLIPSRQVYLFDGGKADYLKKRMVRSDLALVRKTPYQFVEHEDLGEWDYRRMVRLYEMLYLEKHSYLNPQFTTEHIKRCHQEQALKFCGFRDDTGKLQAVIGYFQRDGVMATHFIGYNTLLPANQGLYRMLMAKLLERAVESKAILNLSSGAAQFKTLRGGHPTIEYTAIYCDHLNPFRQVLYRGMAALGTRIGLPILKTYRV